MSYLSALRGKTAPKIQQDWQQSVRPMPKAIVSFAWGYKDSCEAK